MKKIISLLCCAMLLMTFAVACSRSDEAETEVETEVETELETETAEPETETTVAETDAETTEAPAAETEYGEGEYYIYARHYITLSNGVEDYEEHVIFFKDGEIVFHVFELETEKGSCGVSPTTGEQYGYDIEDCEFYGMTLEQIMDSLEADGFEIETFKDSWENIYD